MQNTDGRLILTTEVTKNKIVRTSKISVCKTNLPQGLNGKSVKHKRIVTNKGLKFKMRDNDWLLGLSYLVPTKINIFYLF